MKNIDIGRLGVPLHCFSYRNEQVPCDSERSLTPERKPCEVRLLENTLFTHHMDHIQNG